MVTTINTVVISVHNCHQWSQLSSVVTTVISGHNCHQWSQLSSVVTTFKSGHNCHQWTPSVISYHNYYQSSQQSQTSHFLKELNEVMPVCYTDRSECKIIVLLNCIFIKYFLIKVNCVHNCRYVCYVKQVLKWLSMNAYIVFGFACGKSSWSRIMQVFSFDSNGWVSNHVVHATGLTRVLDLVNSLLYFKQG